MGLLVFIRDDQRTTGVVANIDGPFEPKVDDAYLLVPGPTGIPILVPAIWQDEKWVKLTPADMCGPMDSGKLADSSDSRWGRAVRQLWATAAAMRLGADRSMVHIVDELSRTIPTAVSVHDRFETWDTYNRMSR